MTAQQNRERLNRERAAESNVGGAYGGGTSSRNLGMRIERHKPVEASGRRAEPRKVTSLGAARVVA